MHGIGSWRILNRHQMSLMVRRHMSAEVLDDQMTQIPVDVPREEYLLVHPGRLLQLSQCKAGLTKELSFSTSAVAVQHLGQEWRRRRSRM